MTTSSIVARSALVLDVVSAGQAPMTLSKIVEAVGLPKSSVHRILSVLVEEALLAVDKDRQVYGPGPRLITWATNALGVRDLPAISAVAMETLSERAAAHVALSILDGTSVLFIRAIEYGPPFKLAPRVGDRSSLHVCAAGKAMLAHVSPSRRQAILDELQLERFTNWTILDFDVLESHLSRSRETGIATCDREEFLQVSGIAAPIFDQHGDAIAALSLWNTVNRQDIGALLKFRNELLMAARTISQRLGYRQELTQQTG